MNTAALFSGFIRDIGAGLVASSIASQALAQATAGAKRSGSESLLVDNPYHPEPAPLGVDRLPLNWYKRQAARIREAAAGRGVDAVVFGTDDNIVYFTGCFRGSGERSTWVVLPTSGATANETVYWYSPGIDRDLIQSWWCTENEYYFCYPHAEGGFPNRGQLKRGRGFLGGEVGAGDERAHPFRVERLRRAHVLVDLSALTRSERGEGRPLASR